MREFLMVFGFIIFYFIITGFILPRMGVPT